MSKSTPLATKSFMKLSQMLFMLARRHTKLKRSGPDKLFELREIIINKSTNLVVYYN